MNNIQRMIESYLYGDFYQRYKRDRYYLEKDGCIKDKSGFVIAKFEWVDEIGITLFVTMQNLKSNKSLSRDKKILAHMANEYCLPVSFTPYLDTEFGKGRLIYKEILDLSPIIKSLKKVSEYSQDDVKTACVLLKECTIDNELSFEVIAYSYNQLLSNEYAHAESTLLDMCREIEDLDNSRLHWISILEPCFNCLEKMLTVNTKQILFLECHKEKWNSHEYIQLVNDILTKKIVTNNNERIIYLKTY